MDGTQLRPANDAFRSMSRDGQPWALVADDDASIRTDVVTILEDAGFGVIDVGDATEALDRLAEHHHWLRLLFTDVHMPGRYDGFHLARETARLWPRIKIVVASGQAKPGPGDMPANATFIPKPFSAQVVHDHLRETMPEDTKPRSLRS